MGFVTIVTCWPLLVFVHVTAEEPFALPPDIQTWRSIFLNGCLDAAFNACLVLGISTSSALVMSAGACESSLVVRTETMHAVLGGPTNSLSYASPYLQVRNSWCRLVLLQMSC